MSARNESAAKPRWLWAVVLLGYFLPCLIGICVWGYLQVVGSPTVTLHWIFRVIPILVKFSFLWVLPFVAVAFVAGRLPLAQIKYRGLVYGAFLGTALFEVFLFGEAWKDVEAIFLGFFLFPVASFAGTLLGALFGFLVGWHLQLKKPT